MAKVKSKPRGDKSKSPSRISQAVAFMTGEVKKAGGVDKLKQGFRKQLCERAAEKFGLAIATCLTQYQKQIVAK
jgi:hypothetical protein